MSERRTAAEWWDETRELMNHINANPVITATYPCLEPVVGYLRDMNCDLAACERERDEWKHTAELESDAAVECLARAEKAEAEVRALREELADYRLLWETARYSDLLLDDKTGAAWDRIESRRTRG